MKRLVLMYALIGGSLLVSGACASEDTQDTPPAATTEDADTPASPPAEPSQTPTPIPSSKPSTKERAAGATTVKVIDTDYRPVTVTIAAGSKVNWKQIGDQPHSVTGVDGSFDSSPKCGPIDSDQCLGEGDTFSHRFQEPGEFIYYCRVHGLPDGTGMVGTVIVE